jgi:signal transduction histidine kinase/CheY-like chemotaxis protein
MKTRSKPTHETSSAPTPGGDPAVAGASPACAQRETFRRYLEAAAAIAAGPLNHDDADRLAQSVLEQLVQATGARRALWLQAVADRLTLAAECHASDLRPLRGESQLQDLAFSHSFPAWDGELRAGRSVTAIVDHLGGTERELLIGLTARMIRLTPVLAGERFNGVMVLCYADDDMRYMPEASALLKLAADSLSIAFKHRQSELDKALLEQQVQHSQKMESLGELSSGISHNFRNILAGIIANCQLIQMKYHDHKDMLKSINGIVHLAEVGSELVNKLLKFSRKGEKEHKAVFNLTDILEETCQIISTSFDKRIEIRRQWDETLPIEGVRSELSQLIMNLCTNARDAMPTGGILQISAREERIKERIYLSISDTGSGMSEEVRKKIFDPFFTTKEPGRGTGLGLSTAYGIARDHGGEIHVNSTPGVGTIFQILLPMARAKGAEREKLLEPVTRGNGEKVLVVDDDLALLETVKDLLNRIGYRTETAENGQMGIEKYLLLKPDVILIDRNMPEIDGITAANNILAVDPQARVVVVSGYEEEGPNGIEGPLRDAIKAYMIKPFNIAELSRVLAGVIAG